MSHVRSRWIAAPLGAASVTLTYAACQAGAVGPETGEASRSGRTVAVLAVPCLAGAATLVGDLDADGNPDRMSNPGNTGTRMTVQWGTASGSFGPKHSVDDLLGVRTDQVATAAVADFTQDGTLDIVVNIVQPSGGDDPATRRVADFRPGPLKRADLGSRASGHFDVGDHVQQKYGRFGAPGEPPTMPTDAWKHFYKPCS
ncbi:FG-GAP repeat domain-containing protein [Streptomyces aureocirculatus]|uniref:FG-GAP repeat domain-containing protein n=1 Tax=Streptomyces aureocirculatus TaxID=67275 RepID=UPI0004CA22E6|nr:VCBS repeat-containing protein [Streptomyces aureocirculatus]